MVRMSKLLESIGRGLIEGVRSISLAVESLPQALTGVVERLRGL
jgi:hypothetical protein